MEGRDIGKEGDGRRGRSKEDLKEGRERGKETEGII